MMKLAGRCIAQESWPSSNLHRARRTCVRLWRW